MHLSYYIVLAYKWAELHTLSQLLSYFNDPFVVSQCSAFTYLLASGVSVVNIYLCCLCSQVFMDMTSKWQTGAELSASFTVEVGDLDEAGQLPYLCILK